MNNDRRRNTAHGRMLRHTTVKAACERAASTPRGQGGKWVGAYRDATTHGARRRVHEVHKNNRGRSLGGGGEEQQAQEHSQQTELISASRPWLRTCAQSHAPSSLPSSIPHPHPSPLHLSLARSNTSPVSSREECYRAAHHAATQRGHPRRAPNIKKKRTQTGPSGKGKRKQPAHTRENGKAPPTRARPRTHAMLRAYLERHVHAELSEGRGLGGSRGAKEETNAKRDEGGPQASTLSRACVSVCLCVCVCHCACPLFLFAVRGRGVLTVHTTVTLVPAMQAWKSQGTRRRRAPA